MHKNILAKISYKTMTADFALLLPFLIA